MPQPAVATLKRWSCSRTGARWAGLAAAQMGLWGIARAKEGQHPIHSTVYAPTRAARGHFAHGILLRRQAGRQSVNVTLHLKLGSFHSLLALVCIQSRVLTSIAPSPRVSCAHPTQRRRRQRVAAAGKANAACARQHRSTLPHRSPTTMAGLDQQALLAKLQQLNIAHENHAHAAVMTCDAQVRSWPAR